MGRRAVDAVDGGAVDGLGRWAAARLDEWWEAAGRPDPFTAVVISGDDGALAAAVRGSGPACLPALRYVLVHPDAAEVAEPPPALSEAVPLENPAFLYPAAGPGGAGDDDFDPETDERPPAQGIGPLFTLLREVPSLGEHPGALIAVECLSRLPYDLFEAGPDGRWCELRLAADGESLVEISVPAPAPPAPMAPPAGRYRRLTGAAAWLRRTLPSAAEGPLAVVDRWAPGAGAVDYLDLDQLRQVRLPVEDRPQPIEGTPLSVVTWRLG